MPFDPSLPTYLRVTDISTDGRLTRSHRVSISHPLAHAYFLDPGDLVFARSGSVGKSYLYDESDGPLVFAGYLVRVQTDTAHLMPEYLAHWTRSESYWRWVVAISSRSVQPGISASEYATMPIPIPPLAEQRAIVEMLSDTDDLLLSLEALVAKKRAIKWAAMQQLLTGRTRPAGCRGPWRRTTLAAVASAAKGEHLDASVLRAQGSVAYLNGGVDASGYTDRANTPAGSIAVSEGGNSCGYVQFMTEPYWSGSHCYSILPKGIDRQYLYQGLKYHQASLMSLRTGSGLPNIQKSALLAFSLRIPTETREQRIIATILSDMDAEITAHERRVGKVQAIRHGMLQHLVAGKLRLEKPQAPRRREETAPSPVPSSSGHSWQFNEAVVIAVLADQFGSEEFPLGRLRYTKFSYLLHRHSDGVIGGYLKKAAGPYNPRTRYGGPERIAETKGYTRRHHRGKFRGLVPGAHIEDARRYFEQWYGEKAITWLEQFRRRRNEELEVLTTVDMAAVELRDQGESVSPERVRRFLQDTPEWKQKLGRTAFTDAGIGRAIEESSRLFGATDRGDDA